MNQNIDLEFMKVTKDDINPLTLIMRRAFDEDTKRHLGKEAGGPPGYDNGEFISKWYIQSGADAYKVLYNGKLIGGFNIFHGRDSSYFLGNIFIDPKVQDQGIGTQIWHRIEKMYPDAKKWGTETPGFSKRNHNFYVNKCGFCIIKINNPGDIEEESYILEKKMR
jgi:GNAT superfamily N-acetyltransferase